MHTIIDANDRSSQHTTLKDWRSVQRGPRSSLRGKLALTVVLVGLIAVFLSIVWQPLVTPQLCVLSIGPKPPKKSNSGPITAAQQAAIVSLEQFKAFTSSIPTSLVLETRSLSDAKLLLSQDNGFDQPRIIHLAGVALISNDRPMLLPAQSESGMRPESLDIANLLQRLATSECPSIVLVDAIENESVAVGRLPEITAWHFSRCLDREITQMHDAKVLVVTHHARARGRSPKSVATLVSPLTQAAIDGFGSAADYDKNGIISAAEWLDVVSPLTSNEHSVSATRAFSSIKRSQWKHVALAPVQPTQVISKTDLDTTVVASREQAATASVAQTLPTKPYSPLSDSSLSDSPSPVSSLKVAAPTLAVAIAMMADGIETNSSDNADKVLSGLKSLLDLDVTESDANAWLASPTIAAASWDEVIWMRSVMSCNAPWKLKQNLIECRILANQLAIRSIPREWFNDEWQRLQWNRLDAERSLLSPVRSDNAAFVAERVQTALRGYIEIQQCVDAIHTATQLCAEIQSDINTIVSSSIHARMPKDDAICQLLADTIDLQNWLAKKSIASMHSCTTLTQSIQERRAHLANSLGSNDESSSTEPAVIAVMGLDSDFMEKTRTRMARSRLAAEVMWAGGTNFTHLLSQLKHDSDLAIKTLSSSTCSEEEIVASVNKFERSMNDLRSAAQPPFAKTIALDSRESERSHWSRILNTLANDTRELAADATHAERMQWVSTNVRYQRLAMALGVNPLPRVQSDFQIDAIVQGSLVTSDRVSVDVAVKALAEQVQPGRLEIEFDGEWLHIDAPANGSVDLTRRMVNETNYQTVAAQRLVPGETKSSSFADSAKDLSVTIQVNRSANARRSSTHQATAFNVRWITGEDIYRTTVPLEMPLEDIVQASLDDGIVVADRSNELGSSQWIMHANRESFQQLSLTARTQQTRSVQVRLLAWAAPIGDLPPTMSKAQAESWLASRPVPVELAALPEYAIQDTEPTKILFPPAKLDTVAAPIKVGSLCCEVTDRERDVVQLIDLSPQVYRPASLIRPEVAFDRNTQLVTVSIEALDGVHHPTRVEIELVDAQSDRMVASGDLMISPNTRTNKSYSAAECDGRPFIVRVLTDQWPSAFVFHIAGDRSEIGLVPSDAHAAVSITIPDSESETFIVPPTTDTVPADVWVDLSDSHFRYHLDQLTLGFDLNGDRYLDGEPSVNVTTPTAIEFTWAGINANGVQGLHSHVRPHRLAVPVGLIRNRRVPLLAYLQRGELRAWSNPLTGIFDSQPPKIKEVQIRSPLPAVLGAPVDVRVAVDDAGLSDAASIRAGWATNGQQEFTADIQSIAGQKMDEEKWAVMLPSDSLASGTHTLLIQATDAAQNLGEVKSFAMEIRSESEWIAQQNSESTAVRGKIAYVTRPVAGMKVALTRQEEALPANPDEKPGNSTKKTVPTGPQASKLTQEVQTDAGGNFVFPEVRAGEYELTLEGLYRGMKYTKSVRVAVKPPQPSNVSTIRID